MPYSPYIKSISRGLICLGLGNVTNFRFDVPGIIQYLFAFAEIITIYSLFVIKVRIFNKTWIEWKNILFSVFPFLLRFYTNFTVNPRTSIRNNFKPQMEPQANTSTRNHEFNYFYKLLSIQFWVIFGGWGSYRIRIHRFQFHATWLRLDMLCLNRGVGMYFLLGRRIWSIWTEDRSVVGWLDHVEIKIFNGILSLTWWQYKNQSNSVFNVKFVYLHICA